jgi:O-antigen/teichoic acid export membrane protein
MSIVKKLASQTAIYGLSTMVGRFINYLLVPLYTAYLSDVSDYGVVSVMFGYASLFSVVFALGLETAFFHFAQKTEKPERVFSTATHTLIITGFVWVILSRYFADSIMTAAGYPTHPEYAIWFTLILATDAITALGYAWLRNQQKPWQFAIIRLSNIGINVLANIFFLIGCPYLSKHGYSWADSWAQPENMVSNIFISNLIASLFTFPMMFKSWRNLVYGLDFTLLKQMLKYAYPLIFIGLAGMINETFDRVLLKQLLPENIGDYEVSIYSAFYKLSLILTLFVQAFRFAVEPFFFQQAKSLDSKQTYAYVMKWFVYAVSIIYLFTIVILPYIAPLLIRNKAYFNHPSGMKIVPILLAANLCLGIYYTLSVWYKVSGKTKIGALPAFAGAIITLALNYILIPKIGFLGSAYTTLIAYASMVVFGYFLCQKYFPIPYQLLPILGSIFIAIASGYMILNIENTVLSICAKILSLSILVGGIYIYEKFIYVSPIKNENNNQN